jgi:hypothetical protein
MSPEPVATQVTGPYHLEEASIFPKAAVRGNAVEAGAPSGVTSRAGLADLQQDGILIAVDADLDDMLFMAGRIALAPERIA